MTRKWSLRVTYLANDVVWRY